MVMVASQRQCAGCVMGMVFTRLAQLVQSRTGSLHTHPLLKPMPYPQVSFYFLLSCMCIDGYLQTYLPKDDCRLLSRLATSIGTQVVLTWCGSYVRYIHAKRQVWILPI